MKCTLIIPLLTKKPTTLILHVGINNLSNEISFQIYDKLLSLVVFIKENNPKYIAILSSSIDRLYDANAALTIKILIGLLLDSARDNVDNSNIGHSFWYAWTASE